MCKLHKANEIDVSYFWEDKLDQYFDEFTALMQSYFDKQIENYLDQIESLALQKTLEEKDIEEYLSEINLLLEKVGKIGQTKSKSMIENEIDELWVQLQVSLTLDDQIAKDYALQRWGALIKWINETTQKQMSELINKALEQWRSKGYLAEQIKEKFIQYNEFRAKLIAHNEIALAYGYSKGEQFKEFAGVFGQIWWKRNQTQNDEKVRYEHYLAQEEWRIAVDQPFASTGTMQEPHDYNCRCVVVYRLFLPDEEAPFLATPFIWQNTNG